MPGAPYQQPESRVSLLWVGLCILLPCFGGTQSSKSVQITNIYMIDIYILVVSHDVAVAEIGSQRQNQQVVATSQQTNHYDLLQTNKDLTPSKGLDCSQGQENWCRAQSV